MYWCTIIYLDCLVLSVDDLLFCMMMYWCTIIYLDCLVLSVDDLLFCLIMYWCTMIMMKVWFATIIFIHWMLYCQTQRAPSTRRVTRGCGCGCENPPFSMMGAGVNFFDGCGCGCDFATPDPHPPIAIPNPRGCVLRPTYGSDTTWSVPSSEVTKCDTTCQNVLIIAWVQWNSAGQQCLSLYI
jgi:hypothetical protein